MGEYSSYLFERVSGPLSDEARARAEGLSSRIQVGPQHAYVEYQYGSFKHDSEAVLLQDFDIFRQEFSFAGGRLIFRFDDEAVSFEELRRYHVYNALEVKRCGKSITVDVKIFPERPELWKYGGMGMSNPFNRFYAESLRGDFRWLYLCWVMAAFYEPDQGVDIRISMPPGCGEFTDCQRSLIDFFDGDELLLAGVIRLAGKYGAETLSGAFSEEGMDEKVDQLEADKVQGILLELIRSPDKAQALLLGALREKSEHEAAGNDRNQGPSIAEIEAMGYVIKEERRVTALRDREAESLEFQKKVLMTEKELWNRAGELIETRQPKSYDAAVSILRSLCEVALVTGAQDTFEKELSVVWSKCLRLTGLKNRMSRAGLVCGDLREVTVRADWKIFDL